MLQQYNFEKSASCSSVSVLVKDLVKVNLLKFYLSEVLGVEIFRTLVHSSYVTVFRCSQ